MRDQQESFYGAACPACKEQRTHTTAELREHHPLASKDRWTEEELEEMGNRLARSCGSRQASQC